MKKVGLMSVVLLAVTGLVFAQQPTLDKLKLVPIGTTGYDAQALDKNVSGTVVIPGFYNNKPVTRVNGFANCPGVTGVVIPENVTLIGWAAFQNGSGLIGVTIPASVTKIDNYAFQNCNNLTSVTFLSSAIDMNAANNTVFPGDLVLAQQAGGAGTYTRPPRGGNWTKQSGGQAVGYAAPEPSAPAVYYSNVGPAQPVQPVQPAPAVYYGGSAPGQPTLEKLKLVPLGTTGYDAQALDKNISGMVVIPGVYNNKPVTRVNGFANCPGVTGVVIPENVNLIGWAAFQNGSGLTGVTIPASVTKIDNYAFQNCNNITSVTFLGSTLDMNAGKNTVFPGDLVLAYQAGGAGTYVRQPRAANWVKQ